MVWGNRSTAMARTGRNGAPWTLLDGALHRLKKNCNVSITLDKCFYKTVYCGFCFPVLITLLLLKSQSIKHDSLNEIVHGCLGIARHIHQPLQMLCSPDGKYHLGICSIQTTTLNMADIRMSGFQLYGQSCVYSRRPALGGSTMAVTLGDTRALRMLGNTSSAFPQWNSTLVRPSNITENNRKKSRRWSTLKYNLSLSLCTRNKLKQDVLVV